VLKTQICVTRPQCVNHHHHCQQQQQQQQQRRQQHIYDSIETLFFIPMHMLVGLFNDALLFE